MEVNFAHYTVILHWIQGKNIHLFRKLIPGRDIG